MSRLEGFFKSILSLKENLHSTIPLLHELAVLATKANSQAESEGLLHGRINRLYLRLCRVTSELGRLDFKKASVDFPKTEVMENPRSSGFALEDFVFSQIDFSRYREISEGEFNNFFLKGLADFTEEFFIKNFSLRRSEIQTIVQDSYVKANGHYKILRENPIILSIMRNMETSLENSSLFTTLEIQSEIKTFLSIAGGSINIKNIEELFCLLALSLENVSFHHDDGMTTKLFISGDGDLAGIFRPQNKPWTRILISKVRDSTTPTH